MTSLEQRWAHLGAAQVWLGLNLRRVMSESAGRVLRTRTTEEKRAHFRLRAKLTQVWARTLFGLFRLCCSIATMHRSLWHGNGWNKERRHGWHFFVDDFTGYESLIG